jgi:hypothetical protein
MYDCYKSTTSQMEENQCVNELESVRVGFVQVTSVLHRSVTKIKRLDSANSQAQTKISLCRFSSLKLRWS